MSDTTNLSAEEELWLVSELAAANAAAFARTLRNMGDGLWQFDHDFVGLFLLEAAKRLAP